MFSIEVHAPAPSADLNVNNQILCGGVKGEGVRRGRLGRVGFGYVRVMNEKLGTALKIRQKKTKQGKRR